jgi:hypothetical protein
MPVRFLSPSLGGSNGPLLAGHWALGLAYRHLGADQWFVGTDMHEAAAPFGHPLFLNIDSLDASVSDGVSDRVSLTPTMPFSRGTHSRVYADGVRHTVQASGLGDTSMQGNIWLRSPSEHPEGNFAVRIAADSARCRRLAAILCFQPGTRGHDMVPWHLNCADSQRKHRG